MNAVSRPPDILIRTAPPLSTTSDAPLTSVPAPPETASNHPADRTAGVAPEMTPHEAAAAARARTDPGPEAAPAEPTEPTDPAPKPAIKADDPDTVREIEVDGKKVPLPPYLQREMTKARNRQRAAEAKAAELEAAANERVASLAKMVEELKAKVPAEPDPPADIRPSRAEYDDPDAYDTALAEWGKREGIRAAEAARAEAERVAREAEAARIADAARVEQEAQVAKINADWKTRRAAAEEKYDDYAEVAEGDHTVSETMAVTLMIAENGPDIAYHLGQNPDESARIAALAPQMQIFEIGRLAARLAAPARPRAPRPIEPIDSGAAAADTSDREPSMEEYAARRIGELRQARRPFFPESQLH